MIRRHNATETQGTLFDVGEKYEPPKEIPGSQDQIPYTIFFEEFWQLVWRRVAKQAAFRCYRSAIRRLMRERQLSARDAHDFLCIRARLFADSPRGQAGQFSPHPATWLYQARYDDSMEEWYRADMPQRTHLNIQAANQFLEQD